MQTQNTKSPMTEGNETVLAVEGLVTAFDTPEGVARAVDDVTFSIRAGHTLGLVGESGCGKSVTALSIMRLVPSPPGRIAQGRILYRGENLLESAPNRMREIRGNRISMIFQEPMTSLNPVFTAGDQVAEVFQVHQKMSKREARAEAVRMLERVRIPDAARRAREYPHQMSGGMRQRVMIAMALACQPDVLIADEPTTALDVTVQAQILALMDELQRELQSAILLITHDLGVIAETADRVAVMYAGMIVERGSVEAIFDHPLHPYTRCLLRSLPKIGALQREEKLQSIAGVVPDPSAYPSGCRFHPRCPMAEPECAEAIPRLEEGEVDHEARCIRWRDIDRHLPR